MEGKVAVFGSEDFVMPFSALGVDTYPTTGAAGEVAEVFLHGLGHASAGILHKGEARDAVIGSRPAVELLHLTRGHKALHGG